MVLGFAGGRTQRGDLVLSAERSIYAVFGLHILAAAGIVAAFLGDRFEYWYVANYANRELELFYKVTGLWAGQRGSLLFWALLLGFFSSLAVFQNRRKHRELMPYVAAVLQTILAFFVIVLLFADVNPFERLAFTPANGRGLNPQLQNYWMTIHPPTLYLGFTAFTIPFAFAMSALLSGRLDARWIQLTRRWILTSWLFLSVGIVMGMRWAYEELGWGGYWFWDPVENASLLPWLTATAFLHSIQIQEQRGMLKVWNMSLVLLTFLLTIFATFLTRSGLIESVHSFAQEIKIAMIFLAFMGSILAACVVLILYRLPQLRSENQIESFVSRESAFLFNNLILLGAAFTVMWGTMFPLISEGVTGQQISVGPPFFERVNFPIGLALLALAGIGPVIAWRRATRKNLQRNFATPVIVGLVVAAAIWGSGARHALALTTWGISAFVLTIIATEFWKGTRARAHRGGRIRRSALPPGVAQPQALGRLHRARRHGDDFHGLRRCRVQHRRALPHGTRRRRRGHFATRTHVPAPARRPLCVHRERRAQPALAGDRDGLGVEGRRAAGSPHDGEAPVHDARRRQPAHDRGRHPVVPARGSLPDPLGARRHARRRGRELGGPRALPPGAREAARELDLVRVPHPHDGDGHRALAERRSAHGCVRYRGNRSRARCDRGHGLTRDSESP
jgi:c-type cytochrome biogenesis protein CcmF